MLNSDGTFVSSSKNITFNESNTQNIMVPLIPFNCLFDTNVGLIKLIYQEFNDSSVFDKNTLDSLDTNFKVTKFVYNSTSSNILLDIMIDKDKDIADEYYKQFMEEEYADILRNSVITDIFHLFEAMLYQRDIRVTVFCERFEEINFLHEYVSQDIDAILLDEVKNHFDLYKQFYFKSCSGDYYFNSISRAIRKKAVYILDYPKNFNDDGEFLINDYIKSMQSDQGVHFSIINTYSHRFNEGETKNNE